MKKVISVLAAVLISLTINVSSAIAGPATEALNTCMADKITDKDRKEMARWIFAVMSAHPEIQQLSNVKEKDRDQIYKAMADMVTRLLTEDCRVQAKDAIEKERVEAPIEAVFGVIVKSAMQELMTNPEVNSASTSYVKYLDANKVNAALSGK